MSTYGECRNFVAVWPSEYCLCFLLKSCQAFWFTWAPGDRYVCAKSNNSDGLYLYGVEWYGMRVMPGRGPSSSPEVV